VPALLGGNHEILLCFEEDVGGALDRTIDPKLLCVGSVQLTQQVDDAPPYVCRNQLDIAQAAFLHRAEELIRLAQLVARSGRRSTLPGPESMLRNFQNGPLDHRLRRHDRPRMEQRVESQEVYAGKLFQVFRDSVRFSDGRVSTREIVRHPGSVGIVPRRADGRIVLVRQFRYVTGHELWEIPAGTLDKPGEEIVEAARRELAEEAGLKAARWTMLGSAYLAPGYCDERMTFFLAEDLETTEAHAELDESFQVNPFDLHDLQVLRTTGELQDAKTLLGLAWAGVELWELPRRRV
jgi:ADP-ribose pyrophosphatase